MFVIMLWALLFAASASAEESTAEIFLTKNGYSFEGYDMMSDAQRAAFDRVLSEETDGYTVLNAVTQAKVDAWLDAAAIMDYMGLATRLVGKNSGIRSQYSVDMDALSVLSVRYRVTLGAVMGIGEYNGEDYRTVESITVSGDHEIGYAVNGKGAAAVVVYDSDGASYASNLFNSGSTSGERVFTYTTIFSDPWENKDAYTGIGLVYRGFLVLNMDGTDYVFYYDADGPLFGNETARYGKATTLAEICEYFTTSYVDKSGEAVYAKNEKLRSVVMSSQTTHFTVTAADMVEGGSTVRYEANEEAGTRETLVMPIGSTAKFTVNAARAGFYQLSFDLNTLGGYVHYLSAYNESLGKSLAGNSMSGIRNDTRLNESDNATLTASYATYFSSLYGVAVSSDDVRLLLQKAYTYTDGEGKTVNPDNEAFRVASAVSDTYVNASTVYLCEGTNVIRLTTRSESGDTRISKALGIAAVTLTMQESVNPDAQVLLFANDAHTQNGKGGYAFGDDGIDASGTFVEEEYLEKATDGYQINDGMMLRISGYMVNANSGNYLTLPLTVSRNGVYSISMLYSGGSGTFSASDGDNALFTKTLAQKATFGGNASGTSLTTLGEVSLKAGKTYSVKVRMTGNSYLSVSLLDFSCVRATDGEETILPKTEFTYPVIDTSHVVLSSTVYADGSTTAVVLSQGNAMTITVPCELSGLYRVHVNGKTDGTKRIGYINLYNTTTSYTAWKNRMTEARVAINAADATGSFRDIDIGYQYLSAGENNEIKIVMKTAESPLTLDSVTFTYCGGDAKALTTESIFVSADEATTFEGVIWKTNTDVCVEQKTTRGLCFNQNIATTKAGFGTYTFTDKISLSGGTYRVYPFFTYCNSSSNLDKIGFSLTDENGGFYQKTLKADWIDCGHTVAQLQPFSSTAVAAFDFGTWTLDAGDYTLKVFNEYNGIEYFAGLWLVRVPDHTVTVHYVDENGVTVAEDAVLYLNDGEGYNIQSPKINGHTADTKAVTGVATEDAEITVVYNAQKLPLRIDYVLSDGTVATPSYTATLSYGSKYAVSSPKFVGYRPAQETVSGTLTAPMLIKVRYAPGAYTVTVNYVNVAGETVAASVSESGAYGESYEIASPAVEGYAYCSLPVVAGGFDSDHTVTVTYAASDTHIFTASDMTLNNATVVTPSDTDATQSVYFSGSSNVKNPTYYAEMQVTAAVAGVYKADFLYNSNGYRVDYLYLYNKTVDEPIYTNTRFENNGKYDDTSENRSFAVSADMVEAGYNNTESIYVYLAAGDNTLRLYAYNTTTRIAVHSVRLTLVEEMTNASHVQVTKDNVATDSNGKSMTDSKEVNALSNAMMLRSQYAVWKIAVPNDGYYTLSALLARASASVTVTDLGADGTTEGESLALDKGTSMSGSSAAAKYVTLGNMYLTAGTHYLRVKGAGSWLSMQSIFAEPTEAHDVTIRYIYADGTLIDNVTGTYAYGDAYFVNTPKKLGYTVSEESISGTMGHAAIIKTVVYTVDPSCVTGDDRTATFLYNGETVTVTASAANARAAESLFVLPNTVLRNDADVPVDVTLTHGGKIMKITVAARGEYRYGNKVSLGGVDIWNYRIVYAQSAIDKEVGSLTGKTVRGDIGAFLQGENAACDFDYQTALRLRDVIAAYSGILLDVIEDTESAKNNRYEILVGNTNREESKMSEVLSLGVDDFVCKASGTKYVVAGGAYGTTWHAVDALEGYLAASGNEAEIGDIDLSGTYALKKIACCGDSITRGSQALPDGPFATSESLTRQYGGVATTIYLEQYLSYPSVLGRENWKDCIVYNFGHGGATMLDLNETSGWSYYYRGVQKYADCLAFSNRDDFAFDFVFVMLGTNDGSVLGRWDESRRQEYLAEARTLLDEILVGSPDAAFVLMNVPHVANGDGGVCTTVRAVQRETAQALKDEGYNLYHYDMGTYMRDNLTSDASMESTDKAVEYEIHKDYYNLVNEANNPDPLHPTYLGYGKMAEGVDAILEYLLGSGDKPTYMIDLE